MGLATRVKRLEGNGQELCEQRYCMRRTTVEVIRYSDGTEERVGEEPPPKCASCPYRERRGPICHVEVMKCY
jgi:hypothetical protein